MIQRSKDWWMRKIEEEGDFVIGAGVADYLDTMESVLRTLVFVARTSGGVAGRDVELCAACDMAEELLALSPTDGTPAETTKVRHLKPFDGAPHPSPEQKGSEQ